MQENDRFFASLEYRKNIEKKRNFVKIWKIGSDAIK
jgi:hypothetical protein